jgi:RNA polymerase sigma-70 factor, ECF subfamily
MSNTLSRAVTRPPAPTKPLAPGTEAEAYLPMTDEAAARFVTDWTPCILSQMARFRLPADLAEDATQEALLRAMRALPKFRGKSKLSTWIYSIAWREGHRAHHRWQRHKQRVTSNPSLVEDADGSSGHHGNTTDQQSPSDSADILDQVNLVQSAMDNLPIKQRLALGYHYLEEMSVEEIATLMKAAPSTVKSWLKRGRDKLRSRLNNGVD